MEKAIRRWTLKQTYILALTLVFALAVMKFIAVDNLISEQADAAAVINISGRQRMLSQRTAFYTVAYMASETDKKRSEIRQNLIDTVTEFSENHMDLIQGNSARGLPVLDSPEIMAVYYSGQEPLDQLVKNYVDAVQTVLNAGEGDPKSEHALDYILDVGPGVLLTELNNVVKLHEKEAYDDVELMLRLQIIFLGITGVLLLLEALFLFRPMAQKIEESLKALHEREDKIQKQFKELERFTFIASHDLKEPVRKISGFVQKLEKTLADKLDGQSKTYLDFILSGADHLHSQVGGLHEYATATQNDQQKRVVKSEDSLKAALRELDAVIKQKKAVIKYDDMPELTFNKDQLTRVFEHLIDNAMKFSGNEVPEIHVSVHEEKERWVFEVADNGIGIKEEFHDRIFEMFQRLHRKESIPGAGVGLAVTRKIIEHHGGEIWVKSSGDGGSTFYFSVPKS